MKKIKLFEPTIDNKEFSAVKKVLKSGWLTYGKVSLELEEQIKKKFKLSNVIAVNSCTNGLHASLVACDIGRYDEVITSPFTFVSTINNLHHIGSKIVLADINREDFNIDLEDLNKKVNKHTKCILPVHYGGNPADIFGIKQICKNKPIKIIEDAATAIGSKIGNRYVGSLDTEASVFSLYGNKIIISGEGGIISVKNSKIEKRIRKLIFCGMEKSPFKRINNKQENWKYNVTVPGYKYNMSDVQSSIALAQFKKIDKIIPDREKIANLYTNLFSELINDDLVRPIKILKNNRSTHYIYTLLLNTEKLKTSRDDLINYLKLKNIDTTVHYIPAHKHKFYAKMFKKYKLPNCNYVFERIISIPMHNNLTNNQINFISKNIKKFIKKKAYLPLRL